MQRSLFLLAGMARLLGQWQLALPGSLPAACQVVASFLALVAQARPGDHFPFHCGPVSPAEKVQAQFFQCRLQSCPIHAICNLCVVLCSTPVKLRRSDCG